MVAARSPRYVQYEVFLAMESASEDKHEWVDGVVYAMTRGTPEHGRLAGGGCARLLSEALRLDCELFGADTPIFIEAVPMHTYADASLVCGPLVTRTVHDKNGQRIGEAIVNPTVIVEVLSDTTERYDRDGKFAAYKRLPSLEQYVLISQSERRIEVRTRGPGRKAQKWSIEVALAGETITVHGHPIAVDHVYGVGRSSPIAKRRRAP